MSGAGHKVRDDPHADVAQGEGPVHTRDKPDDSHNNAEDGDAPALLHLGDHQQIDGAAQQGRAHGHVKGQNRVWRKGQTANQRKDKKDGAENASGHKVLDRKALLQ